MMVINYKYDKERYTNGYSYDCLTECSFIENVMVGSEICNECENNIADIQLLKIVVCKGNQIKE